MNRNLQILPAGFPLQFFLGRITTTMVRLNSALWPCFEHVGVFGWSSYLALQGVSSVVFIALSSDP
ncbi:MAG: hypothetical protein ACT4PV_15610 [Planctomycetaceae bacterium]